MKIIKDLIIYFKDDRDTGIFLNQIFEVVDNQHSSCVEIESNGKTTIYPLDTIDKIEYEEIEKEDRNENNNL